MIKFKVLDISTGREVSAKKIAKIAKETGLMEMDIDQFFIGEDGRLMLADDCGQIAYYNTEKLGLMPVLEGKYPDLEYLEAIFLGSLRKIHPEAFETDSRQLRAELVAMFPQTWPDTAGGFSEPGMMAEQAFTTQPTTVMKVRIPGTKEEYYGVFFGNKPAYLVSNANEAFFKDLRNRQLKSKYEARKVY